MTDIVDSIFKKYGSFAIIAALVLLLGIWALAHYTAAAGTEVSVLWGLVRYTKSPEIHTAEVSLLPSPVPAPIDLSTPEPAAPTPLPMPVKSSDQGQLDLKVINGITQTNMLTMLTDFRSKRDLRELSAAESGRLFRDVPVGTYGFIDAIEFGFLRVEPLKVDRYTKNILPSVEVHFMASGPEVVLFMTESDAASIVKLTGALHHGVTAFASSFPTIGSLVSIPINRIVSAQYRTIQFAPQDMTPALDLELQ